MDNKNRIIECCEMAIRNGFGNCFVMNGLTWKELRDGLQKGNKLTPEAEKIIQESIEQLGNSIRAELKEGVKQ